MSTTMDFPTRGGHGQVWAVRLIATVLLICALAVPALQAAQGPLDSTPVPGSAPAPAEAPAPTTVPTDAPGPASAPGMGSFLLPIILLLGFMYLFMLRPQKKEQQKRQALMESLKVGEQVVSIGGLHGTIVRKGESDVDLEVAKGVVMTFNIGAVHQRAADTPTTKD